MSADCLDYYNLDTGIGLENVLEGYRPDEEDGEEERRKRVRDLFATVLFDIYTFDLQNIRELVQYVCHDDEPIYFNLSYVAAPAT